ncbi:MAG: hypothetical protein LBG57_05120 [Treponema sp.]|jgi:hypothetical protein|nr:hypothetical protein [Treponema sp.]
MTETRNETYPDDGPNINPTMLFCEQHGWTGANEGICYGSVSCKDAAICVLASNYAAWKSKKIEKN